MRHCAKGQQLRLKVECTRSSKFRPTCPCRHAHALHTPHTLTCSVLRTETPYPKTVRNKPVHDTTGPQQHKISSAYLWLSENNSVHSTNAERDLRLSVGAQRSVKRGQKVIAPVKLLTGRMSTARQAGRPAAPFEHPTCRCAGADPQQTYTFQCA